MNRKILNIEGFAKEELLNFPPDQIKEYLSFNESIIIQAGTAEILAQFSESDSELIVELAHIDGGGEGILILLQNLIKSYCQKNNYRSILWIIHAVHCKNPNLKLRAVLEKRGYKIVEYNGSEVYKLREVMS